MREVFMTASIKIATLEPLKGDPYIALRDSTINLTKATESHSKEEAVRYIQMFASSCNVKSRLEI